MLQNWKSQVLYSDLSFLLYPSCLRQCGGASGFKGLGKLLNGPCLNLFAEMGSCCMWSKVISSSAYWVCRDWPETDPSVLYGQLTPQLYQQNKFLRIAFDSSYFHKLSWGTIMSLHHLLEVIRWTCCFLQKTSSLNSLTAAENKTAPYSQLSF